MLIVYNILCIDNPEWDALVKKGVPPNIGRWFELIKSLPGVAEVLPTLPPRTQQRASSVGRTDVMGRKEEGKFVDLPGAEMGKVVVRFPPEASG